MYHINDCKKPRDFSEVLPEGASWEMDRFRKGSNAIVTCI